jgi:hypothetical protein
MSDFSRVKVDAAQTGFFRGREYRSFKELSIATGTTYVIQVVVPVNTILQGLEIDADDGYLRMATVVGGVAGGVFSETLPIFNRNNMTVGPDRGSLVLPPVELLADCPHVVEAYQTNGQLAQTILAYRDSLVKCNIDKQALREWAEQP